MIFRAITLQQANIFLPLVKEHFGKIHTLVAEGQQLHDAATAKATVSTSADGAQSVVSSENADSLANRQRLDEIEELVRNEVLNMQLYGAVVKSVFPARVDFLSERHRQPVYLCWQTGDKSVSHWHLIDEGFSSRRQIKESKAFGPVVIH